MISTGNTVIPRLQSFLGQLGGLNPHATVLASPQDGESVLHSGDGSTAAAQREGTQRLKTELHHISFDLEAVLDDFLHVDFRHGAIDSIKALALTDEPITASTLTAALDTAAYLFSSAEFPQSPAHEAAAQSGLRRLEDLVSEEWLTGAPSTHEVLANPPGRGSGPLTTKFLMLGVLASDERLSKRHGLKLIIEDLAKQIDCEFFKTGQNRNEAHFDNFVHQLRQFACLASDDKPVTVGEFQKAAKHLLNAASVATTTPVQTYGGMGKEPKVSELVRDSDLNKAKNGKLYKLVFTSPVDSAVCQELKERGYGASEAKLHFGRQRVHQCMRDRGVKPSEALAIWLYSIAYHPVNQNARSDNDSKEVVVLLSNLSSGMELMPLPASATTWRGIESSGLPPDVFKQLTTPGAHFKDAAPMSTSYDTDRAYPGDMQLTIRLSEVNTAGRNIQMLSELPHEKEILFPPNTTFVVVDVARDDKQIYRITLLELPEKKV